MAPKSAVRYAILAAALLASIAYANSQATEKALAATNSLTLPTPTQGVPTCGSVITKDVTLRADLQCDKDGLIVGADGITINLNGHTITHNDGKNSNSATDPTKIFGGNTGILVPNSNHITVSGAGEIS